MKEPNTGNERFRDLISDLLSRFFQVEIKAMEFYTESAGDIKNGYPIRIGRIVTFDGKISLLKRFWGRFELSDDLPTLINWIELHIGGKPYTYRYDGKTDEKFFLMPRKEF
jgi:hypothetical protein